MGVAKEGWEESKIHRNFTYFTYIRRNLRINLKENFRSSGDAWVYQAVLLLSWRFSTDYQMLTVNEIPIIC